MGSGIGLPPEALDLVFPFHFAVDPELRLVQRGHGWVKLDPAMQVGSLLPERLTLRRPAVPWEWDLLRQATGVVVLEPPDRHYTVRGQFLLQAQGLLFLGGPWVTDSADLARLGLEMRDFPGHDQLPDLLQLLQMQKLTMADQEKLVTQLSQQRRELKSAQKLLEAHQHMLEARVADLERAESINRSILETAADAIVTIDAEGLVQRVNPAFERLFGYDAQEILGQNIHQIVPEPDRSRHDEHIRQYLRTGQGQVIGRGREVAGVRKDGSRVPVFLSVGDCRVAGQHLFTGILRDITDLLEQREALSAAREQEVEIASQIQSLLLFADPPVHVGGLEIAVMARPSQRVDGDFYEFFRFDGDSLDLVIGDVMGKGVPAALLGAAVKAHLQRAHGQLLTEGRGLPTPQQVVNRLHVRMSDLLVTLGAFVTAGYARLSLSQGRMEYVDCGHTPVLLVSASGEPRWIKGGNVPLGFLPQEHYESVLVELHPGDLLIFYSDGVSETVGAEGEQYGERRLKEWAASQAHQDPVRILEALEADLKDFEACPSGVDDRTCLVVKVVRREGPVARAHRELQLSSDPFRLPLLRDFIKALCQDYYPQTTDQQRFWIELAVNEVFSNLCRHAYGGRRDGWIRLAVDAYDEELMVRIYHSGVPLDPDRPVTPVEEPQEGGMGLYLIAQSARRVEYSTDSHGRHCVLLSWRLGAPRGS